MTSIGIAVKPLPDLRWQRSPLSSKARRAPSAGGAKRSGKATQWLAGGLAGAGLALIPWLLVLARTLPSSAHAWNWSTAWVGLDTLEMLGLLGTGLLMLRRDIRYRLSAAATSALLLVDAWFDIVTSAPGADRLAAVVMAAALELPIAVLCAILATRGHRASPAAPLPEKS
jgi:hypothetical protein